MPICGALAGHGIPIAPRTYWTRRSRPPSQRALTDEALTEILAGIYEPGEHGRRPPECLYGSLKMWEHLNRQGITVARCTVERLMRGVTRARTTRTTIPDPASTRAPDLVRRNFTADRPGQLHVADFTYSAQLAVMCSPAGDRGCCLGLAGLASAGAGRRCA